MITLLALAVALPILARYLTTRPIREVDRHLAAVDTELDHRHASAWCCTILDESRSYVR